MNVEEFKKNVKEFVIAESHKQSISQIYLGNVTFDPAHLLRKISSILKDTKLKEETQLTHSELLLQATNIEIDQLKDELRALLKSNTKLDEDVAENSKLNKLLQNEVEMLCKRLSDTRANTDALLLAGSTLQSENENLSLQLSDRNDRLETVSKLYQQTNRLFLVVRRSTDLLQQENGQQCQHIEQLLEKS
eukprot:Platyproteum_vivax@DN6841_c0_g1_i2.p1